MVEYMLSIYRMLGSIYRIKNNNDDNNLYIEIIVWVCWFK
jgi:hypothetical protein